MNTQAISHSTNDEIRRRNKQISLWYTMLLTGVVCGAYMPLAYWGFDGILLSIWIGAIGLTLMHEFLLPAGVLIIVGILSSMDTELPLSSIQEQTVVSPSTGIAPGDLVIPLATIFGVGVFVMAAIAWLLTSMPQDVRRAINALAPIDEFSGLQAAQFSLFHLVGLMTVVCLAAVPVFYGGMAAGFSASPLIMLSGMLAVYRKYGFAFGIFVILAIGIALF